MTTLFVEQPLALLKSKQLLRRLHNCQVGRSTWWSKHGDDLLPMGYPVQFLVTSILRTRHSVPSSWINKLESPVVQSSNHYAKSSLFKDKIKLTLGFFKGHKSFFIVCSKVVLFIFRKGFLKIFFASIFLCGANFQNLVWI